MIRGIMTEFDEDALYFPDLILPDQILNSLEDLNSFYLEHGQSLAYCKKVDELCIMLIDYSAKEVLQTIRIVVKHYKLPFNQTKSPKIDKMLTHHKDSLNELFAQECEKYQNANT